jgi:K+-sensing histidine kinase KdpD
MKAKAHMRRSAAPVIFLTFLLSGCGAIDKLVNFGTDTRTETLLTVDNAISALQSESADWQQVLKDTISKLIKDGQSTIRSEISNLLSRTVAQGGVELRCDADFVRERIREELVRLKARFMGQPEPVVDPAFCQVVPLAVDRELVLPG